MFVVMALVTTVATTPLTTFLFPPWYQKKLEAWKRGEIDWDGNRLNSENEDDSGVDKLRSTTVRKLLVYLRLDTLPSVFTFISLLGGDASTAVKAHPSKGGLGVASTTEGSGAALSTSGMITPLEVRGVRILELTDRTSSVMKVSEADEYAFRDPVVNTFRTFAQLNNVAVSGAISIVPESSFAETLVSRASEASSDLILVPWSENGSISEGDASLLPHKTSAEDRFTSTPHNNFIQQALSTSHCNIAIFINRGFGGATAHAPTLTRTASGLSLRSHRDVPVSPVSDRSHHIFFPFFGGEDDRVALRFVIQMAQNSNVTATVIHIKAVPASIGTTDPKAPQVTGESSIMRSPSHTGSTTHLPAPTTADPEALAVAQAQDVAFLHSLRDSLPQSQGNRVVFSENSTDTPLATFMDHARQEVSQSPRNAGDLIVTGRGIGARHFFESDTSGSGSNSFAASEIQKILGPVAQSVLAGNLRASILVVQAAQR